MAVKEVMALLSSDIFILKIMSLNKSFTLIELLVVIAIIGILSGLIIVSLNGANASAQDARTRAGVDSLRKTILAYGIHSGGVYPIELIKCVVATGCPTLSSALVPDYYSSLPADTNYNYISTSGTDFTVSATLSNSYTYSYSSSSGFSTVSPYVSGCWTGAVGGLNCTENTNGSYVINTFTLSGTTTGANTWVVPIGVSEIEYVIVGGGGAGGGYIGGGGGAGGYRSSVVGEQSGGGNLAESKYHITGSALTITVGAGGAGVPAYTGGNGTASSITDGTTPITASGGGGGGYYSNHAGTAGGSGGGGGCSGAAGGSGSANQGYTGGAGGTGGVGKSGGGGGAGGVGVAGTGNRNGGAGVTTSISGTPTPYAGGGGGGAESAGGAGGVGGAGGGGAGSYTASYPTPGTPSTGGGGGGATYTSVYNNGGHGGSGVVIIRYLHP